LFSPRRKKRKEKGRKEDRLELLIRQSHEFREKKKMLSLFSPKSRTIAF